MDIFPWAQILQEVGPLVAVILFFIWRDYKREVAQQEKMMALESYQRQVLENLISQTTQALTQNSECVRWISRIIDRFLMVYPKLNEHECLTNQKPEALK